MDRSELHDIRSLTAGVSRTADHAGVKALMLAVFEEGIRTYREATGRAQVEAEHWVWGQDRSPFSFSVICEVLGLEPSAVRVALTRSLAAHPRFRGNAGAGRHAVTPTAGVVDS